MPLIKEFSSGGIVIRDAEILLILMKTITGEKVWTFPKGHIENGETEKEAALREVFEETGVLCEIIDEKEFYISHYFFYRNRKKIEKKVFWYLMKPVKETGEIQTPEEIEDVRWVRVEESYGILKYDSDKEMVAKLEKWKSR